MRYYVLTIQYNREKDAENRTAPKAFDDRNDAIKEFHSQLAKDMANPSIGWSEVFILTNVSDKAEKYEKYIAESEEATE